MMRIFIILLAIIPFFALADSHPWVNHPIILSGSDVEPIEYYIDESHRAIETDQSIQKNRELKGKHPEVKPNEQESVNPGIKPTASDTEIISKAKPLENKNYVHKAQWFPFPYPPPILRPSNACSAGCFIQFFGYAGNPCQCVFWNGWGGYYTVWGYLY